MRQALALDAMICASCSAVTFVPTRENRAARPDVPPVPVTTPVSPRH